MTKNYELYGYVWEGSPCIYCGQPANSVDHFIPSSFLEDISDLEVDVPHQELLPACLECNSIKRDRVFDTIREARRHIHARLREKYHKFLEIPDWSEDELEELGYSLRQAVRRSLLERDRILARLAWRR